MDVTHAKDTCIVAHLLAIIPDSYFGALARGDLLQFLLVSILSGFAIAYLGKIGEPIAHAIDQAAKVFFGIIRIIVRVAPLGALGAMAFTVGAYGLESLWNLIALIATFYLTSVLFVLIVLDHPLHCLHQGRTADRARHLVFGDRAAADDPEDGAPRRVAIGGRPRHSDRL